MAESNETAALPAPVVKRQAVVVIHGMGEHRPMQTLRSFVDGVKHTLETLDDREKKSTLRSKVDSVGDIYETNRLSMDSVHGKRPITDFYEFYWGHNMRGTKFSHMASWLKQLVFTNLKNVPPRLHALYYTVWGAVGIIVVSAIVLFFTGKMDDVQRWAKAIGSIGIVALVLSLVGSTISSLFLNYAGDAARYFTPVPDNVEERVRIRRQGIAFLKKLHELQKRQKPDRIIVVAHSLGSVVAYDLLRILWPEYDDTYAFQPNIKQDWLELINDYANGTKPLETDADLEAFRKAQWQCWKEQRGLGNQWLISDFVTMGAAINAADYFVKSTADYRELINQRDWPVCPPVPDSKDRNIFYKVNFETTEGQKRDIKVLHHGAMFGVMRWTNIYFTSDFVGGSAQRVFGKGIRDIPIPRSSAYILPGGHTTYWDKTDPKNALEVLVKAMQLDVSAE
jgi:hypothetical protein